MKRLLITVAVVLALVTLIFGWTKTWSYVEGTQQVINQAADDRTPMGLENARIAALIENENSTILGYEDKICDLEARHDSTARAIEEAHKNLLGEMDLLKRIKILLDEKREQYVLGRNTYTYAEVNADSLQRLEGLRQAQEGIAFNESLLQDLDRAIKQGRSSLADARKRVVELKNGMARLEARNANADVREEVAKLTSAIAGAPLSANSELEKACRNYERRVAQKERRASARLMTSNEQSRIDYSAAIVTQDASTEIDRMLDASDASKTTPDRPAARPSASEAIEKAQD